MSAGNLDPGGLSYRIQTSGDFAALDAFNARLDQIETRLKSIKGFRIGGSGGSRSGTGRERGSGSEEAEDRKQSGRERRRLAAIQAYNKETRRLIQNQEKAIVALEKNYRNERKLDTALESRQKAEKGITQELNKQASEAEKLRLAYERNIKTAQLAREAEQSRAAAEKREAQDRKADLKAIEDGMKMRARLSAEEAAQIEKAAKANEIAVRREQVEMEKRARLLREAILLREKEEEFKFAAAARSNSLAVKQEREEMESRAKALRDNILLRAKEEQASQKANASGRAAVESRINRVLGDRNKILENYNALLKRGFDFSKLTEKQAIGLGLASSTGIRATVPKKTQEETIGFWRRLRESLVSTDSTANRISFTFRRLFGILAAFTAARYAVAGFVGLVREMISFNSRIEQARLGIASLLLASGSLRNALGDSVSESDRLPVALRESSRLMNQIRTDSLRTAATFEQLVQTFQVAIAPGLQANLGLDQIRELSVRVSQAASAIGLAQNQLAEEIRSLLEGTINIRTTRIATALGITNEDVRRAKEAGRLFEFLQQRFAAFQESGDAMLNTFSALFNNLISGIQIALGAGGQQFFDELKNLIRDLQDIFIVRDALTGVLSPDPKAVSFFRSIGNAFAGITAEARRLAAALSLTDLATFGQALGSSLLFLARVTGRVFQGIIKGFSDIRAGIRAVSGAIRSIPGITLFSPEQTGRVVTALARIATILVTLRISATLIASLLGASFFSTVLTGLTRVGVALRTLNSMTLALLLTTTKIKAANLGAALASAATSARALFLNLLPILAVLTAISLFRIGNLIYANLAEAPKKFVDAIAGVLNSVIVWWTSALPKVLAATFDAVTATAKKIGQWVLRTWADFFKKLGPLVSKYASSWVGGIVSGIGDALSKAAGTEESKSFAAIWKQYTLDLQKPWVEMTSTMQGAWADFMSSMKALSEGKTGDPLGVGLLKGIVEDVKSDINSLVDFLAGAGDKLQPSSGEGDSGLEAAAQNLLEIFNSLPPIIATGRGEADKFTKSIESLEDELLKVQNQLRMEEATRGLQGGLAEIVRSAIESNQRIKDSTKELTDEYERARKQQLQLQSQSARTDIAIGNLPQQEQRDQINQIIASYEKFTEATRKVSEAEKELGLRREELAGAQYLGDTKAIEQASAALSEQESVLASLNEELVGLKEAYTQTQDFDARAVELAKEKLQTTGQLKIIEERLASISEDRLRVEKELANIASVRTTLLARQEAFGLSRENDRLSIEARYGELLRQNEDVAKERLLSAEQAVASRQLEIQLLREQAEAEQAALQAQINAAANPEERAALLSLQYELTDRIRYQQQLLNTELEREKKLREEAALIQSNPLQAGLDNRLEQWKKDFDGMEVYFQQTIASLQSSFDGFADIISQTIVDAFDPTSKQDLRARFSQFLKSVAAEIIQTLTRIAITRAILGLASGAAGFGFSAGGSVGAAFGMATGGSVGAAASRAPSARVSRPRGLSPRDTVGPVYLDPKEWVFRREAVSKYGHDIMNAINQGLIDPMSLAALLPINTAARSRRSFGFGRATGGPVAPSLPSGTSRAPAASSGSGNAPVVQPAVVANENTMQTLLTGGPRAMLDFLSSYGYTPSR